jgi:hypothetical protein
MQQRKRKTALLWTVLGVGIVGVLIAALNLGWRLLDDEPRDPRFICSHPKFAEIRPGLTQAQIISILGQPKMRALATSSEKWAKEVWTFEIDGWHGTIVVYFGSDGKVVTQSCGYA